MKIGILQTGHAPDTLLPETGDYDALFRKMLDGNGFAFETYSVVDGERGLRARIDTEGDYDDPLNWRAGAPGGSPGGDTVEDRDGDGVREKDGVPLKVLYQTSTNAVRQDFQALIKDWWSQIGVETEEIRGTDRVIGARDVLAFVKQVRECELMFFGHDFHVNLYQISTSVYLIF
mgnify:CR=1 FL=1